MARKKRKRLGEMLVEWGVVSKGAVKESLEYARLEGMRIGEALVAKGHACEDDVARALAEQFDMEYVDLDKKPVSHGDLQLVPEDIVRKHLILPIGRENGRLKVCISDPLDLETMDMLRFRLNTEVQACLAAKGKMRKVINDLTRGDVSVDAAVHELEEQQVENMLIKQAGEDAAGEDAAPIVKLVTMIITEAVKTRASDIHVEPMADRVRVRYRTDGVCMERDNVPIRMKGPVINRLKIMAGIDLAEKRLPQDGRIKMTVGGGQVDFRVSVMPSYHGESIVMRILRPESVQLGIPALGFEQDDYDRFSRIIKRPNGIFLVTGPTGSGKTTTLYSAVNALNRPDRKIITAEDPVEYNFTGINQVQVNESVGLTFAAILRAMLRQAPNIILVGEIRDLEVAEVAIQAALTGHLVFSTLHTNDAPSAVPRLIDMGAKPFLVASSIQAVMAQRLVRTICDKCKAPDPDPDKRVLQALGFRPDEIENTTFYKGEGCDACNHSGYRGRLGIFEMMEMNNTLRELAFNRAPLNEIRRAARSTGMRSLLEDGKLKIRNGITTPDELVRITQIQELTEAD